MLPFAFLIALSQLLYGGDGPGDGFTAGRDQRAGRGAVVHRLWLSRSAASGWAGCKPRYLIGAGLALVIGNAVLPMLFGHAVPASHLNFDQIALPANLHLSSTLIYETGIFLTVLGSITTVMEAIAYPKEVEAL